MRKLILSLAALAGAALLSTGAAEARSANYKPYQHPDRWERQHHARMMHGHHYGSRRMHHAMGYHRTEKTGANRVMR